MRFAPRTVVVVAFVGLACGDAVDDGRCRDPRATITLQFPNGRASFASYEFSGACSGSGSSASCALLPACNGLRTEDCPCALGTSVTDLTVFPSDDVCHIDVVLADGSAFHEDVPLAITTDYCHYTVLVDPSQSTITVGGTANAS